MHTPGSPLPFQSGLKRDPNQPAKRRRADSPPLQTDLQTEESESDAEVSLLARLAKRMARRSTSFWPDRDGSPEQDDNPDIPAGYTYLAQFVAHDLVSNLAPAPLPEDNESPVRRDFRTHKLMLDTLYGGGPATDPAAYAIPEWPQEQRLHLRLGHVANREHLLGLGPDPAKRLLLDQPARDIPRATCPYLNDHSNNHGEASGRGRSFSDVLIPDPRNDDNLILSQLTAVFHELHNMVVDAAMPNLSALGPKQADIEYYRYFQLVRKVVALVYRRIIVKDLLGKLLDDTIFQRYESAVGNLPSPVIFKDLEGGRRMGGRVPVEFSHAVFRFAHAMVRPQYVLNDTLKEILDPGPSIKQLLERSSGRNANLVPLACNWLVEWKHFFPIDPDVTPNPSNRIRPDVGGGVLSENGLFANEHDVEVGGLFFRDLLRGAEAKVASVQSLVDRLPQEDRARSSLLLCGKFRKRKISDWLNALIRPVFHEPDDVDRLSADPPLFFFTLFEAAHDKSGKRLGILGSTIVAEVFFAALEQGRTSIEDDPEVVRTAQAVFPDGIPECMPDLLTVMHRHAKLRAVTCPSAVVRPDP